VSVKILIVDDERAKISRLLKLLEESGVPRANVTVAQTGIDARRLLVDTRFDLLILDVAIPTHPGDLPDKRGGIGLLEELIQRDIYKRPLSVVGLTGFEELHAEFGTFFHSHLWTLDYYDPASTGWVERLTAKVRYILARSNEHDRPQYSTDVCVITGLVEPELKGIRDLPWSWSVAHSLDEVSYFYEGQFLSGGRPHTVIAAAAPRMGMVAAAVLTIKMIARFRPRVLVMTGICAGFEDKASIGDVLVADPVWDWQMGKRLNGAFQFEPDQIDIPTLISSRFVQLAEDQQFWFDIHRRFQGKKPDRLPTIKVGPVSTGSVVLSDARLTSAIREQHRKMLGVELELYGVYAAARDSSPPLPLTFGMKSVADYADERKSDDYQTFAAYVSSRAFAAFCERYICDLV
jgi:nucleoside phosphorylase/CheY-like chemotaxis protein